MIGEVIDEKYKITRLIGEGGMGAVFEGENLLISRRVAIKVLHANMALNEQTVERFQREARAAGKIGNDHILEVLDLGKLPNGDHYMVLEFLDGEPLSERIQRLGHMAPDQLAPLILQVLTGLGAAHAAGIIHRDLKPDNLFVLKEKAGRKDYVKIIDFGISKFNPLSGDDAQKKMTQTGAIMGTPYYMSPEQARGSLEADARSDLYSVGVIIYEALTGEVPFDGKTINELMFAIALNEPKPLDEVLPGLDAGFKAIVDKAMAKDKEHRYQSADEFARAISAWEGLPATAVVTEPPPAGEAAQQGVAAITTGTASTWSKSQADATLGTRNTPVLAATIVGSVVMLGAVAFGAYALLGGDSQEGDASAQPEAAGGSAPVEAPEQPVGVAEPSATTEAPEPEVAPALSASASAAPDVEAAPAPEPAPKVAAPPAPKPAVAPAPKPRPRAPAPAPAPKKSSISRFGY